MRKKIIMIVVSFFVAGLAIANSPSLATAARKTQLAIATASTGGSWYPAGAAIANIITKYIPNVEASAHPSAASRENIRLLQEKRSDLAMLMPDVAYFATTGTDLYDGKPPAKIKGLFSFWGIDLLIIARADSDIYDVKDLKGHKVAFGRPGSGSESMSKKILGEYGITYNDLKPQFISAPEQARALKDKSIDAAMYTIGTPASSFVELCTLTKCRLIPIKKDMMKKILKKYSYYSSSVIPAGAYPKINYDTPALKWLGIVATSSDLNEDLVYKITKTTCKDHLEEFKQCHANAKSLTTTSMAKGMSIPWHPGAAKFWREVGLLK
jgi:hypothetical protein